MKSIALDLFYPTNQGYQGVNGAILVKTKRGVEGRQISVSYDHKFTFAHFKLVGAKFAYRLPVR